MTPSCSDKVTFDPVDPRPSELSNPRHYQARRDIALQQACEFGRIDSDYISQFRSKCHHFGVHFTISGYILPFRGTFHQRTCCSCAVNHKIGAQTDRMLPRGHWHRSAEAAAV
jgi:hypothetical protein